jgi:hypothetical protein
VKPSNEIFHQFGEFSDDSVMLAFRGAVSEQLLDALLEIAEQKLLAIGCETKTRKKAFNILVECLQNLFKHSNEHPNLQKGESTDIIMMLAGDDGIRIATGNTIDKSQMRPLQGRLEHLNQLETKVIRKQYQERLVNGKFSEKCGAGLGFIDIARKSGKQMEYCFSPLDDERLFFTFNVKVS